MSREIKLINSTLSTIVDDDDYINLRRFTWKLFTSRGPDYAWAWVGGKTIFMHQLVLPSNDPRLTVDHRNGNGLDNRKENLRLATESQQHANIGKMHFVIPVTSKYKGVGWHKQSKRWRARICVNQRDISLHTYRTEREAARTYNQAAKKYFGEFAILNEV